MIRNVLVMMKRGIPKQVNVIDTDAAAPVITLDFPSEPTLVNDEYVAEFKTWTVDIGGGYKITVQRPN